MKYEKGSAFIVVLLSIIIIALIAGGIYYFVNLGNKPDYKVTNEQITQVSPAIQQTDQSQENWQDYINDEYSYSLSYPQSWYFYTEGLNPPPPANIMLANMPEGSDFEEYTSFSVNGFDTFDGELEEYGEVTNLTDQGETRSDTTIDDKKAIMFEKEDTLFETVSIYVKNNSKVYRIGYQIPIKDVDYKKLKDICEQILDTFKFE